FRRRAWSISYRPAYQTPFEDWPRPSSPAVARRSRSRDVARSLRDAVLVHLEHPRRALLVSAFPGLDDLAFDQVFDQLPDHVAVGAEHDLVQRSIAEELGQALEAMPFFERRRRFDLEPPRTREWLDCLHAPHVG